MCGLSGDAVVCDGRVRPARLRRGASVCARRGEGRAARCRAPIPPALEAEFAQTHLLIRAVDLADGEATRKAMAAAAMRFGGIDVLVNVAGGFRYETLLEGGVATWDEMYAMNLRTAVASCKAALPALLESGRGRIVNIGAGAAAKGRAGMGAYTASKAGVQRLTESLADEAQGPGRHGECDPAGHDRHTPQPCGHAGRGLLALGRARGDCRGDPVPGLGRSGSRHRGCDPVTGRG